MKEHGYAIIGAGVLIYTIVSYVLRSMGLLDVSLLAVFIPAAVYVGLPILALIGLLVSIAIEEVKNK